MQLKTGLHRTEGTITVFLSLILLLILSLICTLIEGARVSTAKVYAERALDTAMDSVLAEYYGPLWEEYHIFGYYPEDTSIEDRRAKISSLIEEHMSYTFYPNKGLDMTTEEKGIELYNITPSVINIENEAALTDYEGELFAHEATEYMKYQELGNGFEALLNKLSLLETPQEVSYIMAEKLEVEDELAEMDRGILELMELLDGIVTSSSGVETDSGGNLLTADTFIKQICYEPITAETVGINHERIFSILKSRYINPSVNFEVIKEDYHQIEQILNRCAGLEKDKRASETELDQARTLLADLKKVSHKSGKDKARIKELKEEITILDNEVSGYVREITSLNQSLQPLTEGLNAKQETLQQLADQITPKLKQAASVIDNILLMTQKVAPMIDEYEALLAEEKDFIDPSVYQGLEEELLQFKRYVAVGSNSYNFTEMKNIIAQDLEVLNSVRDNLISAKDKIDNRDYKQAEEALQRAESTFITYQIKGLRLDYSSLILDRSGQKAPLEAITKLIKNGLTGLVVEENTISSAEISSSYALPSELAELGADTADGLTDLLLFLQNSVTGQGRSGTGELFTGFVDETMWIGLQEGIDELAECILLQEYLKEHFGSYQTDPELKKSQKPSVLEYEQEYMVAGHLSDEENLSFVIARIILLRTVFDFAGIIGDKTIQAEAKIVATSMVGFTGMPMLISLTQILILLLWSFAEALLDTCALMMGKEIPILKQDIILQLPELFLINREYLMQRASGIANTKELSFSYQDYLRVLLITTWQGDLTYRSMDLIQENIKLRYQLEAFQLSDCLYGFDAEASFRIKSKFTAFPFVKELINGETGDFPFQVRTADCY